MNAPRIAPQPPEPPGAADDPNDPDLCVCGALIVSELVPTLKEVRERMVVIERRVGALERKEPWRNCTHEWLTAPEYAVRHRDGSLAEPCIKCGIWRLKPEDHVHVFVDGFDRCSWCGVAR